MIIKSPKVAPDPFSCFDIIQSCDLTFGLILLSSEIAASREKFNTLFAACDLVGLSILYTEDSKFMITGRTCDIRYKKYQSVFSGIMNSGITNSDSRTIEVWGTVELIIEETKYSFNNTM